MFKKMKKLFKRLFHRNNKIQDNDCEFTITGGQPQPIRNVKYSDQLRVIRTLEKLPVGGLIPIPNKLIIRVRRMTRDYFPEYRIITRNLSCFFNNLFFTSMYELIKRLFHRNNKIQDKDCEFTISGSHPQPIRNVKYSDQLRVIRTLEKLPVGGSFPIRNELTYTVRKMARDYFPEYRITIRNFGTSMRVFRAA